MTMDINLDLNQIVLAANSYKQKAEQELRPMLVKAADGLVKLQLFCRYLMMQFRKISGKELALFVLSVFGFGLFAGIRAPRRYRKLKAFVFFASLAGAVVFLYRLLTKESE